MFWPISYLALFLFAGCSYITPSVRVAGPPRSFVISPLSDKNSAHHVAQFSSCYKSDKKIPRAEALTRQLFVGWTNFLLREPLEFNDGTGDWTGFAVTGELDGKKLFAVALSAKSDQPGCIEELIAFGSQNELLSTPDFQQLILELKEHLAAVKDATVGDGIINSGARR